MDPNADAKTFAQQGIVLAHKAGVELDYSNESIEKVEKLLEKLHADLSSAPSDEHIIFAANAYGCYVGETLLKNLGVGTWVMPTEGPLAGALATDTRGFLAVFPAKAYKTITNGSEDSIAFLYQIVYNKYSDKKIFLKTF